MDAIVRKMHAEFVDLGPHERHVVDTHGRTIERVLDEVTSRLAYGDLRLHDR
jgi:hypothetical protein